MKNILRNNIIFIKASTNFIYLPRTAGISTTKIKTDQKWNKQ